MKTFSHYISLHSLFAPCAPQVCEIYDEMIDWLDERDVEYSTAMYSFAVDSEEAVALSLRFGIDTIRLYYYD